MSSKLPIHGISMATIPRLPDLTKIWKGFQKNPCRLHPAWPLWGAEHIFCHGAPCPAILKVLSCLTHFEHFRQFLSIIFSRIELTSWNHCSYLLPRNLARFWQCIKGKMLLSATQYLKDMICKSLQRVCWNKVIWGSTYRDLLGCACIFSTGHLHTLFEQGMCAWDYNGIVGRQCRQRPVVWFTYQPNFNSLTRWIVNLSTHRKDP